MTAKKRNSKRQQEIEQGGSTSSLSNISGASYATLMDPVDSEFTNNITTIPLAPQKSFGDYVTWQSPISINGNHYYKSFSLKAGYFYSIYYHVSGQNYDHINDPNVGILLNNNFIPDSLIAAPAVTNKPVLLSNTIIISSKDSNDVYQLCSFSKTIVTSVGLNTGNIALDLASVAITVIGEASTINQNSPRA